MRVRLSSHGPRRPRAIAAICAAGLLAAGLVDPAAAQALDENGFRPLAPIAIGETTSAVASGFLNADMLRDIVVADDTNDQVTVLLATGAGTFAEPATYDVGATPTRVVIGRIDNDTVNDIAVLDTGSDEVTILYGETLEDDVTAAGTFVAMSYDATYDWDASLLSSPSDLAVLPVSGQDGFAVTNPDTDTVTVMRWRALDEDYTRSVSYPAGDEPVAVSTGLTGGGLVVADRASDSISVLRETGPATYQPAVSYPAGPAPADVLVTDVTGDQVPDAVVANPTAGEISVLPGNPDGTFAPRIAYAAVPGARALALSAKRAAAIVVAGDADVGVMHLDRGTLRRPVIAATDADPQGIDAADVAGDTSTDVLVADGEGMLRILAADHPALSWSPSLLLFPSTLLGMTAPAQAVTVSNSGPVPVALNRLERIVSQMPPASPYRVGTLDPRYPLIGDTCTDRTLGPGESCRLTFTFAPSTSGSGGSAVGFATTPSDESRTGSVGLDGSGRLVPAAPDAPPRLTVSRLSRVKLKQLTRRRITLTIRASEPCTLKTQARLYIAGMAAHPVLASLTSPVSTRAMKVTVSISKRNYALITKAVKRGRAVLVRVTFAARDSAGQTRGVTRTIRITR